MTADLVTIPADALRHLTKVAVVAEQVVKHPNDGYWVRRLVEVVEGTAPDSPV